MSNQATDFKNYLAGIAPMDLFEAVRVGRQVFELSMEEALKVYSGVGVDGPLDCIFSSSDGEVF